jgi:hypothetical protein
MSFTLTDALLVDLLVTLILAMASDSLVLG